MLKRVQHGEYGALWFTCFSLVMITQKHDDREMAQIESFEDMEQWTEGKPVEWMRVLALRSALRILPAALSYKDTYSILRVAVLRANSISWIACNFPTHDMAATAAHAAAHAAANASANASANAAANAADAAYAASAAARGANASANASAIAAAAAANAAANAAAAAANAASSASFAVWEAVNNDMQWLEGGRPVDQLLAEPLWPDGEMPANIYAHWGKAVTNLEDEGLRFWVQWYQRRLSGAAQCFDLPYAQDEVIQTRLLEQDNDWWDRDLAEITRNIESWVDEQKSLLDTAEKLREIDREQAIKVLKNSSSPEFKATSDGRIDVGPNNIFDAPSLDYDLADLPAILRGIIQTILNSLPPNTPPVVGASLNGYNDHIVERGAQPIVGLIKAWMDAIQAEYDSNDADLWGKGLDKLLQSLFEKHEAYLEHFPLDEERERAIASLPFDEEKALSLEVVEAIKAIPETLKELKDSGLTTADTDKVANSIEQQNADFISLPISPTPLAGTNEIIESSPRKRYIARAASIAFGLLNVTSSIKTITGKDIIQNLKDAYEYLINLF